MSLDNMFYNRKTKTRASLLSRTTLIYPVKTFKKAGYIFFFNSLTIIGNPHNYLVFNKILNADLGSASVFAVFNGIYNKIGKHLLYALPVSHHIHRLFVFHIKGEGDIFLCSLHFKMV